MLNMGRTVPLTTVRVLQRKFTSDALPDTTAVKQLGTGNPVFGGGA